MNREIVVIGAGGHAKVCIEILRAMGHAVALCVGASDSGTHCLGVPVVQGDETLARLRAEGYERAFVAIGSNQGRDRLVRTARQHGFQLVNAISPAALISPSALIGHGVAIMAGAVINAQAVIEDGAIVNTGATVDHDCHIGYCSHVAPQCGLAGAVRVGELAFLGIGCKVIPSVSIGARATVGAGGVVICDIDADEVAVGVPAVVLRPSTGCRE